MSKISHILLPNPVVIPTGTQLNEAAKLMKANKITSGKTMTLKNSTVNFVKSREIMLTSACFMYFVALFTMCPTKDMILNI